MALKAERERTLTQEVDLDRVLGTYIPLVLEAMKQAIGRRCDFSPMEWKDAERLLQSCALAVCEDDFHPAHAKASTEFFHFCKFCCASSRHNSA